ncbi:MAG TPA: hypothetical protein EYH35_02510, partial [Thiotrichaceae bacterium]|nr:hypothetical protein [Thiotrichaceae bacterium]
MTGIHKLKHSSSCRTSSHQHNRSYSRHHRNYSHQHHRHYSLHGQYQNYSYSSYPRVYRPNAIHIIIRPPTQPQFPIQNALALINILISALLGGANKPSDNLTFTGNPKFDEQILNYLGAQKPVTAQNGINSNTNANATNTRTITSFLQALQTFGVRNDQLADLLKPQNATQVAKILSDGGFPISTQQVNQFITEITAANQPINNTTSSTGFNASVGTNAGTGTTNGVNLQQLLQGTGLSSQDLNTLLKSVSPKQLTGLLAQSGLSIST